MTDPSMARTACTFPIDSSPPCGAQIDRRTLLDNLALVLLSIDELVDAGKILEIDPSAIANRVLMRGVDARGPQSADLTFPQVVPLGLTL